MTRLRPAHRAVIAVALFAGAAYVVFPPVGAWPVAWVCLVGLMAFSAAVRGWRLVLGAWLAGMALYVAHLQWLHYVTIPGWFAMAFYLSLYTVAMAWLFGWFWRRGCRLTFIPAAACTVMVLEFVQGRLMTGFGWFFLAYSQFRVPVLIQAADLGGPYLVSGLIAAFNAGLFVAGHAWWTTRGPGGETSKKWIAAAALSAAVLAATVVYGVVRLHQVRTVPGPRLACVQGNVHFGLDTLMNKRARDRFRDMQMYLDMARRVDGRNPDVILLPESSIPVLEIGYAPGRDKEADYEAFAARHRDAVTGLARELGRPLIVNALRYHLGAPPEEAAVFHPINQYNTIYVIDRTGHITDRYDKMHRVPFGEYVPLTGYFPFLYKLTPFTRPEDGILPGTKQNLMTVRWGDPADLSETLFGGLVCFEDTHPYMARALKRRGATLLVNLTNGAWFGPTAALTQHLAVASFRCIETRLPMVRSTQSGVSAMIGPDGRMDVLSVNGRTEGVRGVDVFTTPMTAAGPGAVSPYTWYGDAPVALAGLALATFALWRIVTRRRTSRKAEEA